VLVKTFAIADRNRGAFYNRAALLPMMNPTTLPASVDNRVWLPHDGGGAIAVDPAVAGILVTHHLQSPVGAFDTLRSRRRGAVAACEAERVQTARTRGAAADAPVAVFAALRSWKNEFR
jgi:hypothetical protein